MDGVRLRAHPSDHKVVGGRAGESVEAAPSVRVGRVGAHVVGYDVHWEFFEVFKAVFFEYFRYVFKPVFRYWLKYTLKYQIHRGF